MTFFENKRVVDVACGDKFTVVVAEIEGENPYFKEEISYDEAGRVIVKDSNFNTLPALKGQG